MTKVEIFKLVLLAIRNASKVYYKMSFGGKGSECESVLSISTLEINLLNTPKIKITIEFTRIPS